MEPNPMVGCVIVNQEGKIVAEGHHKKFGESHAEVNALSKLSIDQKPSECTLYVNLEPCSHTGKTPPCCDAILKSKIKKVVVGMIDPNPLVAGRGIAKLRQEGIEVIAPVEEELCAFFNRNFLHQLGKKRPYIVLKWAESLDGTMAPTNPMDKKISNDMIQIMVHQLRSQLDGILVGSHTILEDNPMLNNRLWIGSSPRIFVLDSQNKISKDKNIFKSARKPILIQGTKKDLLDDLMKEAKKENINSLLVEGGTYTLSRFIEQNLWDEAFVIKSNKEIFEGKKSPEIKGVNKAQYRVGDNLVEHIFAS